MCLLIMAGELVWASEKCHWDRSEVGQERDPYRIMEDMTTDGLVSTMWIRRPDNIVPHRRRSSNIIGGSSCGASLVVNFGALFLHAYIEPKPDEEQ